MNEIATKLTEAVAELVALAVERDPSLLAPGELMAAMSAAGDVRRLVDAAVAPIAAEVARQSRPELGGDSFARKQGFRSPTALISATTGVTAADASKTMKVGTATAPGMSLTGEVLPAKRQHVADAMRAGRIGQAAAHEIIRMLDRVEMRVARDVQERAERTLVAEAEGLTSDQLHAVIVRLEATIDPDGLEPNEERLREQRSLVLREERDGSVSLRATLDPISGAAVKAALEGMVTHAFRTRGRGDIAGRDAQGAPAGGAEADGAADEAGLGDGADIGPAIDQRSRLQMQADALVDVFRHALGCEEIPTGVGTTVVVRVGLDELETRTGSAMIDGLAHPISAAAARRAAVDAKVVPMVLGGRGEILDLGRGARLFSPAQKLALAERDGGCAFCGEAPPGQCSAHHIKWWVRDRGKTDLADGVLLCTGCHHRIHDDGWDIQVRGTGVDAEVWFVPPAWLDRARTPRKGRGTRLALAA